MDILTSFGIIVLAAIAHASFQLSASVLLLLSGHALGAKRAHRKVVSLVGNYLAGTIIMTTLVLISLAFISAYFFSLVTPPIVWAIIAGASVGLGLAVWVFYYRRKDGTTLWLPRDIANYLRTSSKTTKNAVEAFSLGLFGVIAELIFTIAPMLIAAFVILDMSFEMQIAGLFAYVAISCLPLLIIAGLIGGGRNISQVQRWREKNKRFIQFIAGSALLVLGFYVYISEVVVATSGVTR